MALSSLLSRVLVEELALPVVLDPFTLATRAIRLHVCIMWRIVLILAAVLNAVIGASAGAEDRDIRQKEPSAEADYVLPRFPGQQEQIVLSTTDSETRLFIRKREPVSSIPHLRLMEDLRGAATIVPFGKSGRCAGQRSGSDLVVACAAGSDVAGIALQLNGSLPPGATANAFVAAEGAAEFRLAMVNAGDDAAEAVPISDRAHLPLPSGTGAPLQLVILAPAAGGEIRLTDLRLLPKPAPRPLDASAWAWQPEAWREQADSLIRSAIERDLARVYISLVITEGEVQHDDQLANFIRNASRHNIAVEAVEGDPRMVLKEGLSHGLERARAIARYQKAASAGAQLAGVQYDIEPYVLPDWGSAPLDYAGWSAAVNALARAVESPVDLVLPFWIANDEAGLTFLEDIEAAASGVTVMSYRADGALAAALAQPLLHWGVTAGKPVRIALEAGPVASEGEETFVPATEGRLALREQGGQIIATLFAELTIVPGARMYASRGKVVTRPERISFLGNEQRMVEAAHGVARVASAWESFAGIGFHGLTWPES